MSSQIDPEALQGLPQFEGLSGMQAAEVKMLDALKRGPVYGVLTRQLKGLLSRDAGHAFQDRLKKNVFKRIIAENVSVSISTKHSVDFELDNALIEAKSALNIDFTHLVRIAARAKELGKDLWYLFLKKPSQGVIGKVKKHGGNVPWFLEEAD